MTRQLSPPTAKPGDLTITAPVEKGGTGSADLPTAVGNLGGVTALSFGQAGGVAKAEADGTIAQSSMPPATQIGAGLKGPKYLSVGQTVSYQITNFDSLTAYDVSISGGVAAVVNDTISVTAPDVSGEVSLSVNGKKYPITIGANRPSKPTVGGNAGTSGNLAVLSLNTTAFSSLSGATLQHRSTDWEVYLDSAMTNLASSSMDDVTNKTSWTTSGLLQGAAHYVRARHRSTEGQVSDWSNILVLTTSKIAFSTEEAKLTASDKSADAFFGGKVAFDSTGARIVVGINSLDASAGKAYVFVREGATWTQEAVITDPIAGSGSRFGHCVSISGLGDRIAVGAPQRYDTETGYSNNGILHVYSRTNSVWTLEKTVKASDPVQVGAQFGSAVKLNSDGTRMVVGAYLDTRSSTEVGRAYVFVRNGAVWTQEAALAASDPVQSARFGYSVSITEDGTRVAIGAYSFTGTAQFQGKVYIFLRTNTSWAQEAALVATDAAASAYYGTSCDISGDGTRLVVGAYMASATYTNQGKIYVYVRNSTTWSLETTLTASDAAANTYLGLSSAINKDGSKIVTAAYLASGTVSQQGKAYIFSRTGSTWTQQIALTASDAASGDTYGRSVAITPTGDRVAVGANQASPGGVSKAGAVYIVS